jgi:hypothetical protein
MRYVMIQLALMKFNNFSLVHVEIAKDFSFGLRSFDLFSANMPPANYVNGICHIFLFSNYSY